MCKEGRVGVRVWFVIVDLDLNDRDWIALPVELLENDIFKSMLRIMIFYFNVLCFQGSLIGLHKSTKDAGDSEMWKISYVSLQVITRQRTFAMILGPC